MKAKILDIHFSIDLLISSKMTIKMHVDLYLHFLVFWDCMTHNPGLEGVRDATSPMISHEKTP